MASNLGKRLAVAAVGIPIVLAVAWVGGILMAVGLGLLAAVGIGETSRMLATRQAPYLPRLAAALATALPAVAWTTGGTGAAVACAAALLAMAGTATMRIPPDVGPLRATAFSFTSAVYLGGLLAFALLLRESFAADRSVGFALFLLPVVVTWLSDTAAYFAGKAFGRRPMAPTVSPNKTVAGGVAGLLAGPAGALGLAYGAVPELAAMGAGALAASGTVIAAAAILGDLVESGLKRECGVKDSSNLLPGHGGLLDRMDSLLWAFPAAWACLSIWLR